jgi:hypothetical protein
MQNNIVRIGHPAQYTQNKASRRDRQNRTFRTGQADRTSRQDRQNGIGRTGWAEWDRQNGMGRTG